MRFLSSNSELVGTRIAEAWKSITNTWKPIQWLFQPFLQTTPFSTIVSLPSKVHTVVTALPDNDTWCKSAEGRVYLIVMSGILRVQDSSSSFFFCCNDTGFWPTFWMNLIFTNSLYFSTTSLSRPNWWLGLNPMSRLDDLSRNLHSLFVKVGLHRHSFKCFLQK